MEKDGRLELVICKKHLTKVFLINCVRLSLVMSSPFFDKNT